MTCRTAITGLGLWALLGLLGGATAAGGETPADSPPLMPVKLLDKYGFADQAGEIVIKAQFDEAYTFFDGLAAVRIGDAKTGKWGFVDRAGKFVINPQFGMVDRFSEGLAAMRVGDVRTGKWGFIDKAGKVVVTPRFDIAFPFSDGLAAVRKGGLNTGKWGFVDKTGKLVIEPRFHEARMFFEGLAAVRLTGGVTAKWGFVDKTGKVVIEPRFDATNGFSEGVAAARVGDAKTGKWGFVDKGGKFAIKPQFDQAGPFSGGLAAAKVGGVKGSFGFVNRSGSFVINPQFVGVQMVPRDWPMEWPTVVWVQTDEKRKRINIGVIGKKGQFIISPSWYPAECYPLFVFRGMVWCGNGALGLLRPTAYMDMSGEWTWDAARQHAAVSQQALQDAHSVVFLVDRSASMTDLYKIASRDLLRDIKRLRDDQKFHVLVFSGGQPVELESKQLVSAVAANRQKVKAFLAAAKPQGQADGLAAFDRAFDVLAKDRGTGGNKPRKLICLLTDGQLGDQAEVLAKIRARNRARTVQINVFLYATDPPKPSVVAAMKSIASQTGGQYYRRAGE